MPTKGEGAIGSLDYTPEERRALAKKSLDFCCETCDCSMRSALLALSPNSTCSPADDQAKELAQQINFKAESSTSRHASESAEGSSNFPVQPQEQSSNLGGQEGSEEGLEQQAEAAASEDQVCPPASSPRSLSPRQRRTQQQNSQPGLGQGQREPPSRPTFPAYPMPPHPPQDASHTGSVVLIVLLTLALAALIFRRVYLTNEYKFDYDL